MQKQGGKNTCNKTIRGKINLNICEFLKNNNAILDTNDVYYSAIIFATSIISYLTFIVIFGNFAMKMSIGGVWFQSDGWRVFDDMTNINSNHYRDNVHPLFSITFIPITNFIKEISGFRFTTIIYALNCLMYATLCSLIYTISRMVRCSRLDSVLLSVLISISAGSVFWFAVPETYPIASISIVFCLLVVAAAPNRDWPFIVAATASLSFTVTNWIAGLSAAVSSRSLLKSAYIAATSLLIVIAGWGVAKVTFVFPGRLFLLPNSVKGESAYMFHSDSGTLLDRLGGEFISPIIAPKFKFLLDQPTGKMLSFQSTIGETLADCELAYVASFIVLIAAILISTIHAIKSRERIAYALLITLAGQSTVHIFYGEETFLYALHFLPLMVLLFATALSSELKQYMRPLIVLLIISAAVNNLERIETIRELPFEGTQKYLVRLTL